MEQLLIQFYLDSMYWLILLVCLPLTTPYDIYSFYQSTFYVDNLGNIGNTGLGSMTFSQDLNFMVVDGNFLYDPPFVYQRTESTYSFLYTITVPESTIISLTQCVLVGKLPNLYAYLLMSDGLLRLCRLTQNHPTYIQTLGSLSSAYLYANQVVAMLSNAVNNTIYLWNGNTSSQRFRTVTSSTNRNRQARAISHDGKHFIQDIGNGTSSIYLWTWDGSTYQETGQYDLNPTLTSQIKKIIIYYDSGTYYAVVGATTAGTFLTFRFTITGNNFTLNHVSNPIVLGLSATQLSNDGLYMAAYTTSPLFLYYYSYNPVNQTFTQLYQGSALSGTFSSNALFTNNNGSFFAVGSGSLTKISGSIPKIFIHFTCDVSFCERCSFPGRCNTCKSGFINNDYTSCDCPVLQTLQGNNCISCNIALCSYCSSVNICTTCSNGYVLNNGFCHCPGGFTVSQVTGLCVICNVTNCSRCDYHYTCSQYSTDPPLTGNTTTPTTPALSMPVTTDNDESSVTQVEVFLIVALALVLVLLIALGIGFLYLLKLISSPKPTLPDPSASQSSPPNTTNDKDLNQSAFKIDVIPSEGNMLQLEPFEMNQNQLLKRIKRRRRHNPSPFSTETIEANSLQT